MNESECVHSFTNSACNISTREPTHSRRKDDLVVNVHIHTESQSFLLGALVGLDMSRHGRVISRRWWYRDAFLGERQECSRGQLSLMLLLLDRNRCCRSWSLGNHGQVESGKDETHRHPLPDGKVMSKV